MDDTLHIVLIEDEKKSLNLLKTLLKPVSLETLRNCIKKFRADYFRKDAVKSEIKTNNLNSELLRINISQI